MKCTLVNFNAPITACHRPSLSPELMAATGARYSRNNEGLQDILSKIDMSNPDKSVDSIFKMVDYGHASIADMAPVSIFIDGISILLAFWLWHICPTASGQESSTRYIRYNSNSMLGKEDLGMESNDLYTAQSRSFLQYERYVVDWADYGKSHPDKMRVPEELKTTDEKKWLRMVRNYSFDRARVFLPLSARTNVMMIQSARQWVETISYLLSFPCKEFNDLGEMLKNELNLATPRLTKYAVPKESTTIFIQDRLNYVSKLMNSWEVVDKDHLGWVEFNNMVSNHALGMLKHRENRYSLFPESFKTMPISFGWKYASMGEIRDLNRHRTGGKKFSWAPNGFYNAQDQVDSSEKLHYNLANHAIKEMYANYELCWKYLKEGKFEGLYMLNLGHTFEFEHSTMLDKYLYESELRTGIGSHYAYSRMMHETIDALNENYIPGIKDVLHIGTAEPEL